MLTYKSSIFHCNYQSPHRGSRSTPPHQSLHSRSGKGLVSYFGINQFIYQKKHLWPLLVVASCTFTQDEVLDGNQGISIFHQHSSQAWSSLWTAILSKKTSQKTSPNHTVDISTIHYQHWEVKKTSQVISLVSSSLGEKKTCCFWVNLHSCSLFQRFSGFVGSNYTLSNQMWTPPGRKHEDKLPTWNPPFSGCWVSFGDGYFFWKLIGLNGTNKKLQPHSEGAVPAMRCSVFSPCPGECARVPWNSAVLWKLMRMTNVRQTPSKDEFRSNNKNRPRHLEGIFRCKVFSTSHASLHQAMFKQNFFTTTNIWQAFCCLTSPWENAFAMLRVW